ncbi:uncharacterized protein RJT20DRAFT_145221 [Scheffersomyces xylosifermentans]|uniref:uncharacterized protein n=1 Tax=Scheffersomyces xylosifermentans TaxID=1304137 RepID=UPI00315D70B4
MARFSLKKSKKKASAADTTTASTAASSIIDSTMPSTSYSHQDYTSSSLHDDSNTIPIDATSPWKRFKIYDSPFPRYRHAAASVTSDKNEIFLMGGLKEGSVFGDTWKIIPQEGTTGEIASYVASNIEIANNNNPPARVGHSSVLCGNAFIIYGGDTVDTDFNGFPDNNFYLFNINNSKYTIPQHILNKPNGRYGHTIGVISLNNSSSRLYLFGGQLENDVFNDLYYFELNTFKSPKASWELVEPLNNFKPPPLTNHSMSVYKNKIYIFGGVYNNEKVSSDLWSFDAGDKKWTQLTTTGNIPLPVNEHSACIVNDKLYVYGGNDFSGVIYDTLFVLDLQTLVWSKLTEVGGLDGPGPRCGHSMTYLPKYNKLVIMGGDKNDYVVSEPDNFETYENYNGEEIGTMIYELDIDIVEYFLSEIVDPVASKTGPKKLAASAAAAVSKRNENPQDYERHARSFSAGPEDFKTPQASVSPERRMSRNYPDPVVAGITPVADKFVEPPSTIQSHVLPLESSGIGRDLGGERRLSRGLPPPEEDSYHNGHAALLDNYGYQQEEPNGLQDHSNHFDTSLPLNDSGIKRNSVLPDPPSRFSSQPVSPSASSGAATSGEDSRIKKLVAELTNELTQLRASTRSQMQNATEKINRLEQENNSLRTNRSGEISGLERQLQEKNLLINELKATVNPQALAITPDGPTDPNDPVSELSKYKLDRLELNNKLIYYEEENARLNERLLHFEPFMNNQIGELSNFQKLIKVQEEKIEKLTHQVKDQEGLIKELNEVNAKYNNLKLEFENYKTIHADDEISDAEFNSPQLGDGNNDSSNRSIISNASTIRKKDISAHLESLVNTWNNRGTAVASRDYPSTVSLAPEDNPIINKLQKQIDELLRVGKQNESQSSSQIEKLRNDLNEKLVNLKTFENNYRDALQSVNNTSKALKFNQEELNRQREANDRLIKENNELKLYKKANKRLSSRTSTPVLTDPSAIPEVDEEEEEEVISTAHYNMKVKDLEADLYILKQERDTLKEKATNLQKQLYMAQNGQ